MYTGIVDHCGVIQKIILGDQSIHLVIACQFTDLVPGESISVNGICLTVVKPEQNLFQWPG